MSYVFTDKKSVEDFFIKAHSNGTLGFSRLSLDDLFVLLDECKKANLSNSEELAYRFMVAEYNGDVFSFSYEGDCYYQLALAVLQDMLMRPYAQLYD